VRILFVNEKCGYFGGVEQNVAATAQGLRSKGHHCFLAYGTETERALVAYKGLFHGVFACPDAFDPLGRGAAGSLAQVVERVAPDVLYIHKINSIDACLPFISKIRTVRMVHDHDLCCPRRHKYYVHNGRVCRSRAGAICYLDLAFLERGRTFGLPVRFTSIQAKLREMRKNYALDRLLSGSRFMQHELLQNGFLEDKIHILPPVVPMTGTPCSPVPAEPVILCVAQLIRGKGVDLLLEALRQMKCGFGAIIVGTGNAESHLRALCRKLGLEARVHFQGWVSNDAIDALYDRARVVVVPSRWPEPFGMIGLEAMNRGRPVVGFNVGGIPDWLEHDVTGLLVPEQDTASLAKALETVLLDRELADHMGRQARERVQERYSFEAYLEQTVSHLQGPA
jgi:glycosyltransferase involved in cell wall biosynthesis